jgi:glycosyltransferase involved in cell wall biosynthesis
MKIVCVSASRVPSDTANSIQAMKVCQALAQSGHAVILLVPGSPPPEGEGGQLAAHYGLRTSFEIRWLPVRNRRAFPWIALRHARRLGAGLVYAWPIQAGVLGLLAGLPAVLEMHDLPSGAFGPLWYRLFLSLPGRKRLLVITHALQKMLDRRYGAARDAVIAPNGVDLERFAGLPDPEAARRRLGLSPALTVACTGHLYAGRGADLFLALAEEMPQVNFLWVGGRPEDVNAWKARSLDRGRHNITFSGFVPNEQLPLYQAAADILLMPYGQEIGISGGTGHSAEISSPMKMFEYLAAGRAILTSDLPVLREVLDESCAVFCPPDDARAWAAALEALTGDPDRRRSLGRCAREAAQKYSWTARARRSLQGFEG